MCVAHVHALRSMGGQELVISDERKRLQTDPLLCILVNNNSQCPRQLPEKVPYSDASLVPSVTLLAPHFKSLFQLAVAYIGVLHKKL